jgi:hypothetical protein
MQHHSSEEDGMQRCGMYVLYLHNGGSTHEPLPRSVHIAAAVAAGSAATAAAVVGMCTAISQLPLHYCGHFTACITMHSEFTAAVASSQPDMMVMLLLLLPLHSPRTCTSWHSLRASFCRSPASRSNNI